MNLYFFANLFDLRFLLLPKKVSWLRAVKVNSGPTTREGCMPKRVVERVLELREVGETGRGSRTRPTAE